MEEAHRMRILPFLSQPVFVLAEHAALQNLRFGVDPGAPGQHLRRFAAVIIGGIDPACRLKDSRRQRARRIGVLFHPRGAGAENFFGMIGPNLLTGGDGKTNIVADGALVPRLAHTEAAHIANLHIHHHLRRRHDDGAHVIKRIDTGIRQPVVQPHRVGAGRKGMGKGETAFGLAVDGLFQAGGIGNLLRFQLVRQGDRLAIVIERHQVRHRMLRAGNAQLQAIDQAVQNVCRIELTGDQLVADGCPTGFFTGL